MHEIYYTHGLLATRNLGVENFGGTVSILLYGHHTGQTKSNPKLIRYVYLETSIEVVLYGYTLSIHAILVATLIKEPQDE